jgi:hypothetical protein
MNITPKHLLFFIIISLIPLSGFSRERGGSAIISYGGYGISDGDYAINGSRLAFSYQQPFSESMDYLAGISSERAEGYKSEIDGSTSHLTTNSTTLKGGIQISFARDILKHSIPFIQGGGTVLSYDYKFRNQGSKIGITKGTGFGLFTVLGVDIRLGRTMRILPAYSVNQNYINTEAGKNTTIRSSGLMLALILSF